MEQVYKQWKNEKKPVVMEYVTWKGKTRKDFKLHVNNSFKCCPPISTASQNYKLHHKVWNFTSKLTFTPDDDKQLLCLEYCKSVIEWSVVFQKVRSNHLRSSIKKVFLEISQNSQENTCARVSILIKLQALGLQLYQNRDSGKGAFLWILQNF